MGAAWRESCVDECVPAGRRREGSGGAAQPSQAAILSCCLHAEAAPGLLPGLLARPEHGCAFPSQEKLTIGT